MACNTPTRFIERNKFSWIFLGIMGMWIFYHYNYFPAFARESYTTKEYITKSFKGAYSAANKSIKESAILDSTSPDPKTQETFNPSHLKVATWNLFGLYPQELTTRTNAVTSYMLREWPDVIFFQELIPSTYDQICREVRKEYGCVRGRPGMYAAYFVGIFYRKYRFTMEDNVKIKFTNSVQNRMILMVKLYHNGPDKTQLALMTSHLESLPRYSKERLEQLVESLRIMNNISENYNVIFGGDLNLEDGEGDKEVPKNIKDVWVECGSPKDVKFTWDATKNSLAKLDATDVVQKLQTRYDRLYFRPSQPKSMDLIHFNLFGKEIVEGTTHEPSDHFGVLATFNLSTQTHKSQTCS